MFVQVSVLHAIKHLLYGILCMFVRIYMYACMSIKSSYIDLYTYLCCFHTFCIDLHACLYDIEFYK